MHDIEHFRFYFAEVITQRWLRKRWSQADMAGFCGLERSDISRLEKGIRTPSLDVVFRFAEAFKISPQILVKEVNVILEKLKN